MRAEPEFTGACIGKHVTLEIDGRFMSAPKVNKHLTGGRRVVTGLTPEEVNRLFSTPEKTVDMMDQSE